MDAGNGNLPSWAQSILALLGGGALVQGLNWFSSHRKNRAEAEKLGAETVKTEAETGKIAAEKQKLLSELADENIRKILELFSGDNDRLRSELQSISAESEARCERRLDSMRDDHKREIEDLKSIHRDHVAKFEIEVAELRGRLDLVETFRNGIGL